MSLRISLSKVLPEFKLLLHCWNKGLGRPVKGSEVKESVDKNDSETEESLAESSVKGESDYVER